jgi:peptide deformylase
MAAGIFVEKKKVKNPPLTVLHLGDRALRTPAKRVTKVDDELRKLIRDMLQTMYCEDGIGLAAPQVGIAKQLVVIDCNPDKPKESPLILINPMIKNFGIALVSDEEGCLSVPKVFMQVKRPEVVELAYKDEHGKPQTMKTEGLLARVIQHEIDHLNGVMFVDRIENRIALDQELAKQGLPVNAVQSLV